MGVEPKIMGKTPQIIHLFIGFFSTIIFTIHFWGKKTPLFFGNIRISNKGKAASGDRDLDFLFTEKRGPR